MEYHLPSEIVKDLSFGNDAKQQVMNGVRQLARAVKVTLGASGKCVIYEDGMGRPVITKDGVTVANSVLLLHPIENIGARLIKEAARNTVETAGDGTTTATVLAEAILEEAYNQLEGNNLRDLKAGIAAAVNATIEYLDYVKEPVTGDMLRHVARISANNDLVLGDIIAGAYESVGNTGVVLMEESESDKTYFETIDGVQFDSGLTNAYFATNEFQDKAELDNPVVLVSASPIPNIRKIQKILEFVIANNKALLIVANVEDQPMKALMMNKAKGNINVNVIEPPGFGPTKLDTLKDLAMLTGAVLIDEAMGDDFETINEDILGSAVKCITDSQSTVLTLENTPDEAKERIAIVEKKIATEENGFIKKKLEQRLAMLTGSVGVIKVGAQSKVELKEKKDRVEDAIYAVRAAIKEGVVPGGGVALKDAASYLAGNSPGWSAVRKALLSPYDTILANAGIVKKKSLWQRLFPWLDVGYPTDGRGIDVTTGEEVQMVPAGIIDPVLVTKTALKNASSVAITIISADCVINNKRMGDYGGS